MKLFDFENIKSVEVSIDKCNMIYTHFVFEKETLNNYNAFVEVLKSYVGNMVRQGHKKENTYFDIELGGKFSSEELEGFLATFGSLLVNELCEKGARRKEDRLNCDNSKMRLSHCLMLRLINRKTKINCFGFGIRYKDCIFELVEG